VKRLDPLVVLALLTARARDRGCPELALFVLMLRAKQARGGELSAAEHVVLAVVAEEQDVRLAA
jgi:hypothetical protein